MAGEHNGSLGLENPQHNRAISAAIARIWKIAACTIGGTQRIWREKSHPGEDSLNLFGTELS
jgi:hypothetical protein